jgi:hypothetical protein
MLTDRGTEYCGKLENHAYQLYLGIEGKRPSNYNGSVN